MKIKKFIIGILVLFLSVIVIDRLMNNAYLRKLNQNNHWYGDLVVIDELDHEGCPIVDQVYPIEKGPGKQILNVVRTTIVNKEDVYSEKDVVAYLMNNFSNGKFEFNVTFPNYVLNPTRIHGIRDSIAGLFDHYNDLSESTIKGRYDYIQVNDQTLKNINYEFHSNYNMNPTQINVVKQFMKNYIDQHITNTMTNEEKIRSFFDYLRYNVEYKLNVNTAYDALFNHIADCSGYSQAMGIYLDTLGFSNFRIVAPGHIWNVVFINGSWKHIDLTFSLDYITDEKLVFLLDTKQLFERDTESHQFNRELYPELQ